MYGAISLAKAIDPEVVSVTVFEEEYIINIYRKKENNWVAEDYGRFDGPKVRAEAKRRGVSEKVAREVMRVKGKK